MYGNLGEMLQGREPELGNVVLVPREDIKPIMKRSCIFFLRDIAVQSIRYVTYASSLIRIQQCLTPCAEAACMPMNHQSILPVVKCMTSIYCLKSQRLMWL